MIWYSLQAEWLKTKNSMAARLCLAGGFFIPLLYLAADIKNKNCINAAGEGIWQMHFTRLWIQMAAFLLPMGLILAASLLTQVEWRNHGWKQVHTSPQSYATIFIAKLLVLLGMTAKFFVFFNAGILISGTLPCLILEHNWPRESIPVGYFLQMNGRYFMACLPLLSFQYLLALLFKNFLVPVGLGLAGLIGTLIAIRWEYISISPFNFLLSLASGQPSFHYLPPLSYALLITGLAFVLYRNKKQKD